MFADKILSSIPGKLAFLKEQIAETLKDIYEIITVYYYAYRDIFSIYSNPNFSIGAPSNKEKKTFHQNKFRVKYSKSNWRDILGTVVENKFCKERHGKKEMCDDNLESKKFYVKTH